MQQKIASHGRPSTILFFTNSYNENSLAGLLIFLVIFLQVFSSSTKVTTDFCFNFFGTNCVLRRAVSNRVFVMLDCVLNAFWVIIRSLIRVPSQESFI